jgi:hypothetical protein
MQGADGTGRREAPRLGYNSGVTAKEALRHVVDDLSEEEAGVWLARMGAFRGENVSDYDRALGQPRVRGETDMERVLGLVDEWMADESGIDEAVLPQLETALRKSRGVRLREPADW